MRLTLRTLIAWLDDTLTPSQVREIGQQVSESPFAKDLVDRLQRVTRQRRLTYPGDLGSEETDPNLVACYLDNELNPEQVADYEKRCLTSDVHLAEVASVHQILSLIGQKAKVPVDAKARMYRLVRGRESTKPTAGTTSRPAVASPKELPVETLSRWTSGLTAKKSLIERFGPAAAVLAAIALLLWAASYSLNPDPAANLVALKDAPPHQPDAVRPLVQPKAPEKSEVAPPTPAPGVNKDAPRPADPQGPEEVASFDAIQGVVLKATVEGNAWDRVEPKAALKSRSHLLNLAPFRNTLKLGKDEVDLVDSTDVFLVEPEKDQDARLELGRGHVVFRTAQGSAPVSFRFGGKSVSVASGTGVIVGIEVQPTLLPVQAEPAPPRVVFFVPEGRATLKAGDQESVLEGPAEISMSASGAFWEKGRQPIPAWVTETTPSGFDKEVGNQFVALLRPGRPILSDLVEAMDDPQKDVKRMAVLALGSIGAMEQVVEVVSRKEDASVHRTGVDVLRTGLAQGGEAAKAVRAALVRQFDQPWAEVSEKLIVGYRPEDAKDEATLAKLVEYLSTAPSRGTRQLALDNLRNLTGRDTLEYDPDSPEGKGLRAWQDVVRKKEPAKEGRPSGAASDDRTPGCLSSDPATGRFPTLNDPFSSHRSCAERAARDAGVLLMGLYGRVSAREKGPGDLVTEADLASQRRIAEILAAEFPESTLLAEEDGVVADTSRPWRWIVDPIDGTTNFAHGFPFWCISIALEFEGDLVVGVIHNPVTGQLFEATRGQGARLDGVPIRVSSAATLRQSLIATGMPTPFEPDADRTIEHLRRMSKGTHSFRRTGSAALNLAYLASGAFDVFYSTKINPWDVAAGVVLIREAGGMLTSISGAPYDLYGDEILATNGLVHAETVAVLT